MAVCRGPRTRPPDVSQWPLRLASGQPRWPRGLAPRSAQGVILGSPGVPHQAPHREPDMGLDPRSPGSGPGLKVVLNR